MRTRGRIVWLRPKVGAEFWLRSGILPCVIRRVWGLEAHLEYYCSAVPGSFGVLPRMEDPFTTTTGEIELVPEKYLSALEFGLPVTRQTNDDI